MDYLDKYKKDFEKKLDKGATYYSTAIIAAAFIIIFLFPPFNSFLMRSAGSYGIYMLIMAILVGLTVYVTERILADQLDGDFPKKWS